jgi:DNA-binding transcriptional ArsR family regulator
LIPFAREHRFNPMVESRGYDLDLIFHALGDPTRRAILKSLQRREKAIGEVAEPCGMSLAAVSKHVKVLERARLVRRERRGSFSFLSIDPGGMRSATRWVETYRRFWDDTLENLKDLLENES